MPNQSSPLTGIAITHDLLTCSWDGNSHEREPMDYLPNLYLTLIPFHLAGLFKQAVLHRGRTLTGIALIENYPAEDTRLLDTYLRYLRWNRQYFTGAGPSRE